MFKKTRIKIITVIMCVFLLLFIGTLCMIYFSSYIEVSKENREMLSRYAQAYWQNGNPNKIEGLPPKKSADDIRGDHVYRLLTFHSVAFSEDGEILTIDNDIRMGITDDELIALAEKLMKKNKYNGISGSWVYYIESNQGCTLVILMDNMIMSGNMGTLFRYTILFGSITIVLLFLLSFFLARQIIKPLEESYQKQRQFISDAGHELKTPIAVISTNAEMLEREFGQSKWLDNVKFESGRMAGLVHQLLELARAENAEPQMNRLNFSRIVTGGVLPFECIAFEKELDLHTNIPDDVYVMGNMEQLGNLVSILLDNALSYAPKHSTITVSLQTESNKAYLSVSNEGKEIPEKLRETLFERFYREDSSRGGAEPHYGLGLAIAKAIVTSHHGKIDVTSKMGQVIFTASLPISS